jgi:hypothetical protein
VRSTAPLDAFVARLGHDHLMPRPRPRQRALQIAADHALASAWLQDLG